MILIIKKINVVHCQLTGADDDSDDESDDESDYSESEEESESETGGLDLDVCPIGCDQTIYDNTCMLREKRLDVEEALAEEKKNRDMLNKELESMQKRAKVIESSAKAAETDLEAFQVRMLHINHASSSSFILKTSVTSTLS